MSGTEKRRAVKLAVVVAALLTAPYLVAWGMTPPERAYLGHLWNPDEPNVYYSWMRQAADGRVLLQDLFTTEPQDGKFTNVFFLGLGWCARLAGGAVVLVYAGARLFCCVFLFYSLYAFAAALGASRTVRVGAVVLGATASGLGWLAAKLGPAWPGVLGPVQCVDLGWVVRHGAAPSEGLMMPEANTMASALLLPLFSFSMALMLWSVVLLWDALRSGDLGSGAKAGLVGLVLGNVHTYDLIPLHLLAVALLLCLTVLRRLRVRGLAAYAIFAALSAPGLLYQLWVFRADAVFRAKALTVTASPSLMSYAVSFGLPLALAAAGAVFVVRRREWQWLPAVCWLAVGLAVAFLPGLSFQRKMIEGVHLPMATLAAVAVARWLPARRLGKSAERHRGRARTALVLAALLCAPSSASFLFTRALSSVVENNLPRTATVFMPPYSITRDDLDCLKWIRSHAEPNAAVLCLPMLGSYVPGLTGHKVYVGHWAETLRFGTEKLPAAVAAIIGDDARRGRPALSACRYMVVGEYELWARASDGRPGPIPRYTGGFSLTPVHSSGDSVVLRIDAAPGLQGEPPAAANQDARVRGTVTSGE